MRVSVLIPAFNAEKTIERCVDSVLKQTLSGIEIIIVNDGSNDKTAIIIDEIAEFNPQVNVIHNKNKGVSSTRNCLVKNARGEYIHFLDADDWMEFDALKMLYDHAVRNNLDIVVSDFYRESMKKKVQYCVDCKSAAYLFSQDQYLHQIFTGKAIVAMWNKLFRRSLFEGIYFPVNLTFAEDLATLPRVVACSEKIGKVNKALVHYIECDGSITNHKMSLKIHQVFDAMDIISKFFCNKSKLATYEKEIIEYKATHVCHFLFLTPYYQNDDYKKGFDKFLQFIKTSKVSNLFGYSVTKKILVYWLCFLPYSWNLRLLINLIQKGRTS